MNKLSLYAYFGLLGFHKIDSPGHSFYQIGLLDSIRELSNCKFDFYSYYPNYLKNIEFEISTDKLGYLYNSYFKKLINEYNIDFNKVIMNIKDKKYERLYLKARFRNLSTLSKKWDDTYQFENILNTAIKYGYRKDEIFILDTDLSLSNFFIKKYENKITIFKPSIDFPGISNSFLNDAIEININNYISYKQKHSLVYYGNTDTSKYKSGNHKNEILKDILYTVSMTDYEFENNLNLFLIDKISNDKKINFISESELNKNIANILIINRADRNTIWKILKDSLIMINVSKDKYDSLKFIPARIYEAMMFGMIPVSYKFSFINKAFSFSNIFEFNEIIKYLNEIDAEDLKNAYLHYCESYLEYTNSIFSNK